MHFYSHFWSLGQSNRVSQNIQGDVECAEAPERRRALRHPTRTDMWRNGYLDVWAPHRPTPPSPRLPRPHAARATGLGARALATPARAGLVHRARRQRRLRRAPPLLYDACAFATRLSPTPPSCRTYKRGAPSPSRLNVSSCPSLHHRRLPLGVEQRAPHPDPTPTAKASNHLP
jgi:hypothetical protein